MTCFLSRDYIIYYPKGVFGALRDDNILPKRNYIGVSR